MKALKVLGIVFGIILLLTGGALLVGSALVGKGQDVVSTEMAKQGLTGPVDGTVTEVVDATSKIYAVSFVDAQGAAQTAQAFSSLPQESKVGDKVSVYYKTDDPSSAVIAEIPGVGSLNTVGSSLHTGGIACLILGAVLLIAGILGLKLGKKSTPAIAGGPAYPGGPPAQPAPHQQGSNQPGYPAQGYGNQPPPPPGYPTQGYGNQPPPPPAYPGQGYQSQPPATYSGPQYGQQPPAGPPPQQPAPGQQPQQPDQGQQPYPGQPGQQPPPGYPPRQQ